MYSSNIMPIFSSLLWIHAPVWGWWFNFWNWFPAAFPALFVLDSECLQKEALLSAGSVCWQIHPGSEAGWAAAWVLVMGLEPVHRVQFTGALLEVWVGSELTAIAAAGTVFICKNKLLFKNVYRYIVIVGFYIFIWDFGWKFTNCPKLSPAWLDFYRIKSICDQAALQRPLKWDRTNCSLHKSETWYIGRGPPNSRK